MASLRFPSMYYTPRTRIGCNIFSVKTKIIQKHDINQTHVEQNVFIRKIREHINNINSCFRII